MINNILRKLLPQKLYYKLRLKRNYYVAKKKLRVGYNYDRKLYLKHSASYGSISSTNLIGNIIKDYHAIEKGLTMPELRLGFGQKKLVVLIQNCITYIQKFDQINEQLQHAIGVIVEYKNLHKKENFQLEKETNTYIKKLAPFIQKNDCCSQIETTKYEYFAHINKNFPEFSNSRASVRNYTDEEISMRAIMDALQLAQKTPSACNRQCWRTYVYTDKNKIAEILEEQGGNRGFGHLTNKLIVLAAELGVFNRDYERNEAYIDGGMYAMNLLYALHYQKIAACILNCSTWPEKDVNLRKLTKIKDSEVFIGMIACGIPPENFKIAYSKRYDLKNTNTVID
jgi:nitroreductase